MGSKKRKEKIEKEETIGYRKLEQVYTAARSALASPLA